MEPEALNKMLGEMDLPSWINFPDFERVRWVNAGTHPSSKTPGHLLGRKPSKECIFALYIGGAHC